MTCDGWGGELRILAPPPDSSCVGLYCQQWMKCPIRARPLLPLETNMAGTDQSSFLSLPPSLSLSLPLSLSVHVSVPAPVPVSPGIQTTRANLHCSNHFAINTKCSLPIFHQRGLDWVLIEFNWSLVVANQIQSMWVLSAMVMARIANILWLFGFKVKKVLPISNQKCLVRKERLPVT